MDDKSIKYLLNQQRIGFKDNWENELNNWLCENDGETQCLCDELSRLNNVRELMNYLYKYYVDGVAGWNSNEYIYHNLLNQTEEDRDDMFEDIINRISELSDDYEW